MRRVDCSKIDLFLLAGDLVFRGQFENITNVIDVLETNDVACPIVSCFGNEEYSEVRAQVKSIAGGRIRFLDDESIVQRLGDLRLGIVGSQGSLEKPTPWQARNIPDIERTYAERIGTVLRLLEELNADVKVLLLHYPPTYKILKGENRPFYPHIGCDRFERVISVTRVNAVFCAHSHMGIPFALVNKVPVYNVSLPAVHKISLITI